MSGVEITAYCPFCGTPARVEDGEHEQNIVCRKNVLEDPPGYFCYCIMCSARGPASKSEAEAVSEWNNAKWIGWSRR